MATTTNFGWPTPDDTDLVKNGAAAMRSLGSGIDTSLVKLKGGTTGQILSKASNTDLDYTWTSPNPGDITSVGVSSPITGGGTSGDVTIGIQDGSTTQKGALQLEDSTSSTSITKAATPNSVKSAYDLANGAIAKTLVDAKGDLIVASGADAVARLAVGTDNQVLIADSSATNGVKWGSVTSGLTLIKTQTIGTSVTSVAVTSAFSSTYDNYLILICGGVASGNCNLNLQLGSTTTGYYQFGIYGYATSTSITGSNVNNGSSFNYVGAGSTNNLQGYAVLQSPNLAKMTSFWSNSQRMNTSDTIMTMNSGFQSATTQFTDFTILVDGSQNITGGTIKVYGFQN